MKYNVSADREIAQKPAKTSRSSPRPHLTAPAPTLTALHDQMGNRAVGRLLQAKLTIGAPDDKYEREADRIAEQVMRMPEQGGQDIAPEAEAHIQAVLNHNGQPLDPTTLADMESRFGQEFGGVRVHTDSLASESARGVNAHAYTIGKDVVFGRGAYAPNTTAGQHLLAHELVHVVQQRTMGIARLSPADATKAPALTRACRLHSIPRISQIIGVNIPLQLEEKAKPFEGEQRGAQHRPPLRERIIAAPALPGWREMHEYVHPGNVRVRITLFKTTNVEKDPLGGYIRKARKLLSEHGLGLDVLSAPPLPYQEEVYRDEQKRELRMLAHQKYQDKQNDDKARLPIIVCPIRGLAGEDIYGKVIRDTEWLPFVLINANFKSNDDITLLHEIGHAANVPGPVDIKAKEGPSYVQNFMEYGNNRTDMRKDQVIAITKSYFAG